MAKSQKERAPYLWRREENESTSVSTPVMLDAAFKEPMSLRPLPVKD